ncbi:glycosyltransferase family 4 protein [Parahaliea mediterranea]|uniref:Glycosyltransferase family 4 protein n=1 Tax=Parahaliea mediterranea TaxID=651086 RepID=A0A939DGB5_9GAMM|nr:glycosyltransferase family 4 protein [Parahaliea mediterranea]MBN7797780.1 glycosyltransferase family 4 protein [Parahaliea mediterranea]
MSSSQANERAPCVLFSANRGYALTSSRSGIIRHFLSQGWEVVIATADDAESRSLVEAGVKLEVVHFSRGGFSPLVDFLAWLRFRRILHTYHPVLVHNFHAKPVILGTLVGKSKRNGSPAVVNTITGLGHAFIKGGWLSKLAGIGYRMAVPRCDATIFQNRDDRELFISNAWVREEISHLIIGSGVDLSRFRMQQESLENCPLVILMVGRLIWQKGVAEFAAVAERITKLNPEVKFYWAGELDKVHPDAVPESWVQSQTSFTFLGKVTDIPERLQHADIMLFPSYREGVPRALLEAAASGVPIAAFDVPGVREVVSDGVNGYLVPLHDIDRLTKSVSKLIEDASIRQQFGVAGRNMAEASFDICAIQKQHLSLYRELGVEISDE